MSELVQKLRPTGRLMGKNAALFLFNIAFICLFQQIFGADNVLPAVALCVGLTMIPFADYQVRPGVMVGMIYGFFLGGGLIGQLALASPWVALPCNLLFVAALFLLLAEPLPMKPFISFILCFVFCQATPVPAERLGVRMLAILAGATLTAVATLAVWRRRGYGKPGLSVCEQFARCRGAHALTFRMAAGLSLAMLAGMLLHLPKPLWISIVVMSLTQLEFHETLERIKCRTVATVIGVAFFALIFQRLVPMQYANALLLLFGYLTSFTPEYRHKQIYNAVCAINASLVLLDTGAAILNRVASLLAGIVIVLFLFGLERACRVLARRFQREDEDESGQELAA